MLFSWSCIIIYASCRLELPKLSYDYCTDNGLIEHKIGQDLQGCIELCARRRLCVSISYCRYSNLCTLRNNDEVPLSSDGERKCIHVAIRNENLGNYSCGGYICNGNEVCMSQQEGDHHQCVTEYCATPPLVSNAHLIAKKVMKVDDVNLYICAKGFTGAGNNIIDCLSNGTFSDTDFKCYRDCPTISSIFDNTTNVSVISTSFFRMTVNTTVTLSCNGTNGNTESEITIKCNEFGDWSTEVEDTCGDGYYQSPELPTCDNNGVWSIPTRNCSTAMPNRGFGAH